MSRNGISHIGRALAIFRAWRSLSQRELAAKAGLDPSSLSLVESGARRLSMDSLDRVAKALRASPAEIMQLAAQLASGSWRP